MQRKGLRTLFLLVCWGIWTERNNRNFEKEGWSIQRIVDKFFFMRSSSGPATEKKGWYSSLEERAVFLLVCNFV
ncbi:Os05g0536101 [Oryza sativa Japonica Group]|uniref:Os05g0536101 protein n=1 Tax=Oryza sativa subsp. japonica TaxID=39947 RepID=A0A0P0WPS8_ORYSJ|nr:hypothetical protein EE612_030861 [Oryza sativa]BAS95079.1 Os05g0536101 [Oryza sativa Japonica Group]